jgi:hypothetical protein
MLAFIIFWRDFIMENSNTKSKLYERKVFNWIMLFIFPPVGIFLLWKYKRYKPVANVILSAVFGILFLISIFAFASFHYYSVNNFAPVTGPLGNLAKNKPSPTVDLERYFPKRDMKKILFSFSPKGEVMFINEEFIVNLSKPDKVHYLNYLYAVDRNMKYTPCGHTEGFYLLRSDKITNICTFGGFVTNVENAVIYEKVNTNFSSSKKSKCYISPNTYKIDVKAGTFEDCLEVVTEYDEFTTKTYYAPHIGEVLKKTQFENSNKFYTSRELAEITY